MNSAPLEVVLVGANATRLWGITVDERMRRIACAQGLRIAEDPGEGPVLIVNRTFVFDPSWLRELARNPGEALTCGGQIVVAHCRNPQEAAEAAGAIGAGEPLSPSSPLVQVASDAAGARVNTELRKREPPFLMRLDPGSVRAAERASYFGAYKGVTDLLTKYLWPEWALVLTRLAARFGISPNAVTTVAALLCVAATILFWYGHYWTGMALGLGFMVLDTVDGKLARCTITSSQWGNIFDHGIDLIHPPFWWYAWGVGLAAYGTPVDADQFRLVIVLVLSGYAIQRAIEGAFIWLFGMHIHVWQRIDSRFRLITARRNPNMVILFVSMVFARPDLGFIAVGWWTILSCLFHFARLLQAMALRALGREIRSWLG